MRASGFPRKPVIFPRFVKYFFPAPLGKWGALRRCGVAKSIYATFRGRKKVEGWKLRWRERGLDLPRGEEYFTRGFRRGAFAIYSTLLRLHVRGAFFCLHFFSWGKPCGAKSCMKTYTNTWCVCRLDWACLRWSFARKLIVVRVLILFGGFCLFKPVLEVEVWCEKLNMSKFNLKCTRYLQCERSFSHFSNLAFLTFSAIFAILRVLHFFNFSNCRNFSNFRNLNNFRKFSSFSIFSHCSNLWNLSIFRNFHILNNFGNFCNF